MARRKTNDLENQMSLMDMMASKSPEYTEEGPEELLDPGEDMEDSEGQTDKPFKLVANKTTKAKASISTQALSVVKAVYADTVETALVADDRAVSDQTESLVFRFIKH